MKKILEITEEVEKHLIDCFDSHLKTFGFSAHAVIAKIMSYIHFIDEPGKKESISEPTENNGNFKPKV